MAIFGFFNQIESATLTSTGTFELNLPLANIQNYILPLIAKTTSNAAFTITATFAADITCGCVFIANHNLARLSTIRIKSYNGATLVDDSLAINAFPQRNGAVISAAEMATLRKDFAYFLPANSTIDKVEIEFTPTNASGGISIGRVFIGESYEVDVDYNDNPIVYKDLSEIVTTRRGIRFSYSQQKLRNADINIKYIPQSEALDVLLAVQRRIGLTGEVVYSATGKQTLTTVSSVLTQSNDFYQQCFIANLTDLTPLNQNFYDHWTGGIKLLEVAI